ncbi:MAG: hypothetical protein CBB97_07155 [Candidatus Endolissoclinum sp. TMED37]|nr:MAG: hypothetical protein CBB97_07155 [Candidatus Endolissoclinum sp. TMED37]|tara:strand:- start:46 stop:333 length:288 start_codon:yes stop_codon:yes gene_type:complete
MTDWEYIYKRRGWTVSALIVSLSTQNWETFQEFHRARGMTCPEKHVYDSAVKGIQSTSSPEVKVKKTVKRTRKTATRTKGATNERKKQGTRKNNS